MISFGIVEVEEAAIVYKNSGPCQLRVNNGPFEPGTLVLTKNEICWKKGDTQSGFMISWEKVTVQAITQEPQRAVYFMIDTSWPENNANGGANGNHQEEEIEDDEGNVSEGSDHEVTEFHLIFEDPEEVDLVYYTMTKFPEHPPDTGSSDDDDFFDGENMEQMNLDDDERFADAD